MRNPNPNEAKVWSESELEIVRALFGTATVKEMRQLLPRHTWHGIRAKGKRMGLTRSVGVRNLPFSRRDGICQECGKPAKLVNSQYISGYCDPCYRVIYARIKYERSKNVARQPVQFYWEGGNGGDDADVDATARSLDVMRRRAAMHAPTADVLPEIAELCQAERRILQQLDALRQHQQQEQAHVKRSLSNRETV